jgi:flagellar biosynthesis anti-sigma factor FlgM
MKIDPRQLIPGEAQPSQVKNSRNSGVQTSQSANSAGVKHAGGEDTVNISTTHSDLQTLSASFAAVPEVRTDRVAALQQRVHAKQYNPDSQKIADALLAEHFKRSAKA